MAPPTANTPPGGHAALALPLTPLPATWSVHQERGLLQALGGVLASPASGQKSSPGLTARQTAAKAERNLNVAPSQKEAKEGDREEVPRRWWGEWGLAEEPEHPV